MYKCLNCGELFEDAEEKTICLEDYYGVCDLFRGRHYRKILICPCCGDETIEYAEEEGEDEEDEEA